MIQQKDSIFCHISKATSLLTRSNISKISQIVRETTLLKLTLNVQIPSIVHLIRVKPLFLSYFIFQLHLTPMITIFFPKGSRNFIGLSDITLNWFCFYLSYCSQYVYSNETHFKPASVYHGISQVSVHYLDHQILLLSSPSWLANSTSQSLFTSKLTTHIYILSQHQSLPIFSVTKNQP